MSRAPAAAEATAPSPPAGARSAALPALRVRVLAAPAALVAYLALAFGAFASAWRDPFVYGIGVRGDPSQFMWFLTWFPFAASHGLNPFVTYHVDHPVGANLLWNTSLPLAAFALWPVTGSFGAVFAYDLMETLALALSAWCAFLLLRRCVRSDLAAAVGGLLYGFSPYMFAQSLGHPHMTVALLPPLVLLVVDELVRVQRRRPALLGAALGVLGAAQLLLSEEVLAITGVTTLVLLAVAAALWPREAAARARGAAVGLLVAAAVFGALVAWPVGFQLFGPQHIGGTAHEPNVYVNDLLGFWVPSDVQWLAPAPALGLSGRFTGNASEWNSYLGVPLTLLLALIAVRHRTNGWVRLTALAGAVVAILSLGVTLHVGGTVHDALPVFTLGLAFLLLPGVPGRGLALLTFCGWVALSRLPIIDNLVHARLMLLVYLLAGLLLAVFLDGLGRLGWRRAALAGGAVVLALAPLVPRLPYPSSEFQVPAFFSRGGAVARVPEGSVALVAPVTDWSAVDAMLWQASSRMRFRMPEGYVFVPAPPPAGNRLGTPPSATTDALLAVAAGAPAPVGDERLRTAVRADLARWQVRTVIVGPMPHEDAAVALLTWVLGRPPEDAGGVHVWWDVDPAAA